MYGKVHESRRRKGQKRHALSFPVLFHSNHVFSFAALDPAVLQNGNRTSDNALFFFFSRFHLFPKLGWNLYYKTKSLQVPPQPPNIGLHWLFKKQRHLLKQLDPFFKSNLMNSPYLWNHRQWNCARGTDVPPTHLLAGSFPWESRRHGIQFENHCSNCNGALVAKFKCEANYITIVSKNNALLFRWNYGSLEFLNWKTLIKFPFIHTIVGRG